MTRRSVSPLAMRRLLASMDARSALLDHGTADRLVQGRLAVDDAPPRYRSVAQAFALVEWRRDPDGAGGAVGCGRGHHCPHRR